MKRSGCCSLILCANMLAGYAYGATVTAEANATVRASWKLTPGSGAEFRGGTSNTVTIIAADARRGDAAVITSIFQAHPPPRLACEPVPAVGPTPTHHADVNELRSPAVPKFVALQDATLPRHLCGTEWNQSVQLEGGLGSVAVGQHSVRTYWDHVTAEGSARVGAISSTTKADAPGAIAHSTAKTEDPINIDLTDETEDLFLNELLVDIEELVLQVSTSDTRGGSGYASVSISGAFASIDNGVLHPFYRTFNLYGDPCGTTPAVSLPNLPSEALTLLSIAEPLRLLAGRRYQLTVDVTSTTGSEGVSCEVHEQLREE